jgi:predicted nucleic acid-binding protein
VILADTSIWIDHFRGTNDALRAQLSEMRIAIHPFVIAELALGNLKNRSRTISELEMLPQVKVATAQEVRVRRRTSDRCNAHHAICTVMDARQTSSSGSRKNWDCYVAQVTRTGLR